MKTAYPNTRDVVNITLYRNIPFDNTYKHHTIISELFKKNNTSIYDDGLLTTIPCERFLNMKKGTPSTFVFPRTTKADGFNFEYGNGLITKVEMELTPEETNSNYMKVVCGTDVYYYFITSITLQNYETYLLSLELDVLMTYQDEFLNGMKDVPVFTKRKHSHRYTNNGLVPYCADYKTGDEAFNGIKPNIIKSVHQIQYTNDTMKLLEGIYWLYVCVDSKYDSNYPKLSTLYTLKNKPYPMCIFCCPIGDYTSFTYQQTDGTKSLTFTKQQILAGITTLVGDGSVHGAKISPYPPFAINSNSSEWNIIKSGTAYAIRTPTVQKETYDFYTMYGDGNILGYGTNFIHSGHVSATLLTNGFLMVITQNDTRYQLTDGSLANGGIFHDLVNAQAPSIYSNRFIEPKLFFAPFRKYVLTAQYSANGCEVYPELELSQYPLSSNDNVMRFNAHTTAYLGDNNYYIEIYKGSGSAYDNYIYEKLGLITSVNYIMPCGTNALDVFNSTQAQTFYTSKIASGITGGISALAGVGSIAVGTTMTIGSEGALSPAGMAMVAGGISALAGGVASVGSTILSTNAKMEDLKNTPNSINVCGSNFQLDDVILGSTKCLPYVVIYETTQLIKDSANDYFYNYGYQVSRQCYFNQELAFDNSSSKKVDNNLFGRTIFNYIQINEDITNKINADIPLIVKKKLSSIFNNGITIWSFFGFNYLWGNTYSMINTNDYSLWFMKNTYDNTEY